MAGFSERTCLPYFYPLQLLTKESEIEISNQQSKSEVKRNPVVGLDYGSGGPSNCF